MKSYQKGMKMEYADSIPSHQALHYQNFLMCSFEDRDLLSAEDRKQIKDLGLSFRERNAWPMFRRYEPGYHPWYIKEEECIFLTHALKQTLIVTGNILAGQIEMDMEQGITIYMPSALKENKGERPYYPRVFILAEQKLGQILDFETYQRISDDANVILNKLMNICLGNGIPRVCYINLMSRMEKNIDK